MIKENTEQAIVANPYRLFWGSYQTLLALLVFISHKNMQQPGWVAPLELGNVGVVKFSFFLVLSLQRLVIFSTRVSPHRF